VFPQFPLTTTAEVTEKLSWLGTARGRIGWLATPAVLLYATGGVAFGEVRHTAFITQSIPDPTTFPVPGFGSFSDTRAGWTAGGGVEWLITPNWSVKFEGLWFDLGRRDFVTTPTQIVSNVVPGAIAGSAFTTFSRRMEGGIARVGVNWHFGGPIISQY
jgi:outer membrane immunogenic protein